MMDTRCDVTENTSPKRKFKRIMFFKKILHFLSPAGEEREKPEKNGCPSALGFPVGMRGQKGKKGIR